MVLSRFVRLQGICQTTKAQHSTYDHRQQQVAFSGDFEFEWVISTDKNLCDRTLKTVFKNVPLQKSGLLQDVQPSSWRCHQQLPTSVWMFLLVESMLKLILGGYLLLFVSTLQWPSRTEFGIDLGTFRSEFGDTQLGPLSTTQSLLAITSRLASFSVAISGSRWRVVLQVSGGKSVRLSPSPSISSLRYPNKNDSFAQLSTPSPYIKSSARWSISRAPLQLFASSPVGISNSTQGEMDISAVLEDRISFEDLFRNNFSDEYRETVQCRLVYFAWRLLEPPQDPESLNELDTLTGPREDLLVASVTSTTLAILGFRSFIRAPLSSGEVHHSAPQAANTFHIF
ncbi:hypothetical protein VKT23_013762 [Stygiomarasmius scandens]|uniref:Uncharacterized protein n=1 Tax=Marasmiellus scandens TaxID=2682957 RepID=A0ABR1J315_9AGAR